MPLSLLRLAVVREEVAELSHGFGEHLDTRQVYHAEVVGRTPVEALAGNQQNLLLVQQIKRELLVVGDVELLRICLLYTSRCV